MEAKSFWKSKVLWANAAALVAAVGIYVQTNDLTALGAAGLSIVNMLLRLATKQPLE